MAKRDRSLRFRPSGWAFLVIAFLVQLAAWNTGTNELYMITGCLLSFLGVSVILSSRTLRGLHVFRTAPASVHRGEPFALSVRIENRKKLLPSVSLRVAGTTHEEINSGYVVKIPARSAGLVRLREQFDRRGVHRLPSVILTSGFPFGMFLRRRVFPMTNEVVVYPRVYPLRPAPLEQMSGGSETPRLLRGESDEFFCLRDYYPGDDIRRISWKVSARLRRLVVREMEPSTSHNVMIGFDTRDVPSLDDFEEQFEEAVDMVASLAVSLINRHYAVGIVTPNQTLELAEGGRQNTRILEMLARVSPAAANTVSEAWFDDFEDLGATAYLYVSPDPSRWGGRQGPGRTRVLDPREVIHA